MPAMTYLWKHPKTGVYWFRRGVPVELREAVGRREVKKTLATKEQREAKRLGMEMAAEVDRLFETARSGVDLSPGDADALAGAWKAEVLAKHADTLAMGSDSPTQLVDVVGITSKANELLQRLLAQPPLQLSIGEKGPVWRRQLVMADTAREILQKQGVALREDSAGFRRLCFALHRALIEVGQVIGDRARGVWRTEVQAATVIVAPALSPLVAPVVRRRRDGKPDATLAEVKERWAREKNPRPKTLHEWGMTVRRFHEVVGSTIAARDITKQHAIAFKDAMLAMPRAMSNELRDKTVPQIIAETKNAKGLQRVSNGTVQKHFSALNSLMEYAIDHDLADENPFERVKPSDSKGDRDGDRLPFDKTDLKVIFSSPLYRGCAAANKRTTKGENVFRDAKFWLPLLALYTGARLDELGQLLVDDVKSEDGIKFLDLNTIGEGKHIKNKGSRRRVPLHPELIRCGFLKYVADLRRRKGTQVFPELKPDARGVWTGALSVWLNRYLDAIGITDKRKVVHSFRHLFKDACRAARIHESVHDALTGHSNGSVGRGYGKGEPLDVLAEAVAKIEYAVDLRHLHKE